MLNGPSGFLKIVQRRKVDSKQNERQRWERFGCSSTRKFEPSRGKFAKDLTQREKNCGEVPKRLETTETKTDGVLKLETVSSCFDSNADKREFPGVIFSWDSHENSFHSARHSFFGTWNNRWYFGLPIEF